MVALRSSRVSPAGPGIHPLSEESSCLLFLRSLPRRGLAIRPANFAPRFFPACSNAVVISSRARRVRAFLPQTFSSFSLDAGHDRTESSPSAPDTTRSRFAARSRELTAHCRGRYNGPAEIFGAAITDTSNHVLCMIITPFPAVCECLAGFSNARAIYLRLSFRHFIERDWKSPGLM